MTIYIHEHKMNVNVFDVNIHMLFLYFNKQKYHYAWLNKKTIPPLVSFIFIWTDSSFSVLNQFNFYRQSTVPMWKHVSLHEERCSHSTHTQARARTTAWQIDTHAMRTTPATHTHTDTHTYRPKHYNNNIEITKTSRHLHWQFHSQKLLSSIHHTKWRWRCKLVKVS